MSLTEQQQIKLDKIQLDAGWKSGLSEFLLSPKMDELKDFLVQEKKADKIIYPPSSLIFNALNTTPLANVKVVILGQDPYHGPNQAHGLSFSVNPECSLPPSLRNIFKEMCDDLDCPQPRNGSLVHWAKQGVLLLNSILTVEAGKPASHSKIGWEIFTDSIISYLSEKLEGVIFLLWGNFALSKKVLIDTNKHFILESPHPSPFSAHTGFLGN